MSRIKEFNLPDLGEGLTEGEILKWYVAEGDTVTLNQPIVEVETAKAAVEIPAKWAGRITRIFYGEGTTVAVGSPIIAIDTDPNAGDLPVASSDGTAAAEPAEPARTPVLVGYGPRTGAAKRRVRVNEGTRGGAPAPVVAAPAVVTAPTPAVATVPVPAALVVPAPTAPAPAGPVLAKPPVRKLARDLGVDLRTLVGSGPLGSITRDDVQAAAASVELVSDAERVFDPESSTTTARFGPDREQRIPMKSVRKLMAEAMVASAFTAPHVTEFLTVDVTKSMRALARLREQKEWREVRVSPLLLVAKAVLLGVARHPLINSTLASATNEIIIKEYVNLGIAAATERGLIVPNIKDAGRLTLRQLADALTGLVATAKEGRTPPADMVGGTITITNVGVFGVDSGTPILPPGESAILAFGAVRTMPWVHKGKVKPREVTTLSLSFDHRVIDGELGSKYLRDVGAFLSDPEASLLAWT